MKKDLLKIIVLSFMLILLPIDLTITLAANETYTVTIPDSYNIETTKTQDHIYAYKNESISVSNVSLDSGSYLHVSVDDTNTPPYHLRHINYPETYTIPFNIFSALPNGTPVTLDNKTLYTVIPGSNVVNLAADAVQPNDVSTFDCYIGFDRSQIPAAGSYSDIITFTVTIDGSAN